MEQNATHGHAPATSAVRKWYQTGYARNKGIASPLGIRMYTLVCTRLRPFFVSLIISLLGMQGVAFAAEHQTPNGSPQNRAACLAFIDELVSDTVQKSPLQQLQDPQKTQEIVLQEYVQQLQRQLQPLCDGKEAQISSQKIGSQMSVYQTLPADLLHQLLSAPNNLVPPSRIVITKAIFEDDIDLSNVTIHHELKFHKCEFIESVDLHSVKTDYEISFEGSIFRKNFDIQNAKVKNSLNLKGVRFEFQTHFKLTEQSLANLKKDGLPKNVLDNLQSLKNKLFRTPEELWEHVREIGEDQNNRYKQLILQHADHSANVNFARSEVAGTLELDGATFNNRLDFRFATVHGNLSANGTQFFNMYGSADFSGLHVGQVVFFNRATFAGPAVFHSMTVGDHVEAVEAEFHTLLKTRMAEEVLLSRCLQSSVHLHGISYQCPSSFANVKVDGNVVFLGAKFWGPVRLPRIQIKGNLLLDQALFARSVVLQSASIEGYVSAQKRAQFQGRANMAGMSIKGDMLLQGALFNAAVDMSSSTIGTDLQLDGAYFAQVADFRSMTIGEDLMGESARFAHKRFADKQGCLQPKESTPDNIPTRFMNVRVGAHLNLLGADFSGPVDFSNMEVGGHAFFADFRTHFRECVIFAHAKITGNLDVSWVNFESVVNMRSTQVGGDLLAKNTKFRFSSSDADMAKERNRAEARNAPNNFNDMSVAGSAFFEGVVFEGLVNFYSVSIGGSFDAGGAQFKRRDWPNGGPTNFFKDMQIGGAMVFAGTHFQGFANFSAVQVGNDMVFDNARFESEISFQDTIIKGNIQFKKIEFLSIKDISFSGMQVSNDADFTSAKIRAKNMFFNSVSIGEDFIAPKAFFGAVYFSSMSVGRDFKAAETTFYPYDDDDDALGWIDTEPLIHAVADNDCNKKAFAHRQCVAVMRANIAGEVDFRKARFFIPVDFSSATIGGDFRITAAEFHYSSNDADMMKARNRAQPHNAPNNFNNMSVAGSAFFERVMFEGSANFHSVSIGGSFDAGGAQFKRRDWPAGGATNFFKDMQIGGAMVFAATHFQGFANFTALHVGNDMVFDDAKFESTVSFQDAIVKGNVQFRGIEFFTDKSVNFSGMQISNDVDFSKSSRRKSLIRAQNIFFNSVSIGEDFIAPEYFFGAVHFSSISVGRDFKVSETTFHPYSNNKRRIDSEPLIHAVTDNDCNKKAFAHSQCVAVMRAHIAGDVDFRKAKFLIPVNFSSATIGGDFRITAAEFHYSSNDADMAKARKPNRAEAKNAPNNFNNMSVTGNAFFDSVVFEGLVNFYSVSIGGSFYAGGAQFKRRDWPNGGPTNFFKDMQISGDMVFAATHFQGFANFTALHVGNDMVFESAQFNSAVSFKDAIIEGNIEFIETKFITDRNISFGGMQVSSDANFTSAIIGAQNIIFKSVNIGKNFIAPKEFFGAIHFSSMSVGRDFKASETTFSPYYNHDYDDEGWTELPPIHIGADNDCNQAFAHRQCVTAMRTNVVGDVDFHKARFFIPVDFSSAIIGGDFKITEAEHLGQADFRSMTVGRDFMAKEAKFKAPNQNGCLGEAGAQTGVSSVDFSNMQVVRNLDLQESRFDAGACMKKMKIGHTANFREAIFTGQDPVDMEQSSFFWLNLEWDYKVDSIFLYRMRYEHLVGMTEDRKWQDLSERVVNSSSNHRKYGNNNRMFSKSHLSELWNDLKYFNSGNLDKDNEKNSFAISHFSDFHAQLEAFFLRQGDFEKAQDVFTHHKTEKSQLLYGWQRVWDWSLRVLVNYGSDPVRPLIWSFGFIIIGTFVYRHEYKEYMKTQPTGSSPQSDTSQSNPTQSDTSTPNPTQSDTSQSNPTQSDTSTPNPTQSDTSQRNIIDWFLYSLDLLTPLIDFKWEDSWDPKSPFGRFYRFFLKLSGLILIYLFLSALSGFLKGEIIQ